LEGDAVALKLSFSKRDGEFGFAAALVAVAGALYVQALGYPDFSGRYPQVLSILLGIGAAALLLRSFLRGVRDAEQPFFTDAGRFVIGFGVLALYVAAIAAVGYFVPSLVLGVLLPLALGHRNVRLGLLATVSTLVFIVLVFVVLLGRPVPRDILDPVLEFLR
jgi:amino acid transporter